MAIRLAIGMIVCSFVCLFVCLFGWLVGWFLGLYLVCIQCVSTMLQWYITDEKYVLSVVGCWCRLSVVD